MIEIINYKEVNRNTLKGYADVYLPNSKLEIFGCSYHVKDGREWVSMPQKEIAQSDGTKKYFSVVRYRETPHRDSFSRHVIEAIKNYQTKTIKPNDEEVPF
jgi:hypothetical protein